MKKGIAFSIVLVLSLVFSSSVLAISDKKEEAIMKKCDSIHESLKATQKADARLRSSLGPRFEAVLFKFITPLNIRLVENNMSNVDLIDNQNDFATARMNFTVDYTLYQQGLEELVAINCKTEPERFYKKLEIVRKRRAIMSQDVLRIRNLISKNLELVTGIIRQ